MTHRFARLAGFVVIVATVGISAGCGGNSSGQLPKYSQVNQSKNIDCANSGGLPGFKNGKQICNKP